MRFLLSLLLLAPLSAFGQLQTNTPWQMRIFSTVSDMVSRAQPSDVNKSVYVLGRNNAYDGGGGVFTLNASATNATNRGTIFKPASTTGRWFREFTGPLNVVWFGADVTEVSDSTAAIQNAFDSSTMTGPAVYIPSGTYRVSSTLNPLRRGLIYGDGSDRTFIHSYIDSADAALFLLTPNSDNVVFSGIAMINKRTTGSNRVTGVLCDTGSSSTHLYFDDVWFEKWTRYAFKSPTSFYVDFNKCKFYRNNNIAAYGGTDVLGASDISIDANANAINIFQCRFGFSDQFIDFTQGHQATLIGNSFEQAGIVQRVGWTPGYFIDIGISRFSEFVMQGGYVEACVTATNKAVLRLQNCQSPNVFAVDWFGSFGGTNLTHNFIEVGTNVFNFEPWGNNFEDQINKVINNASTSYVWAHRNTVYRSGGVLQTKNEIRPYYGVNVFIDGDTFENAGDGNAFAFDQFTASSQTNSVVLTRIRTTNTTTTPVSAGYGAGFTVHLPRDSGNIGEIGDLIWKYTQTAIGLEDTDVELYNALNSSVLLALRLVSDGSLQLRSGTKIIHGSGSPEGSITATVGSVYLRTDGSSATTLYSKISGAGNTGWEPLDGTGGTILGASNIGSGVGVFSGTTGGTNLAFNSLAGSGGITVVSNTSTITIGTQTGVGVTNSGSALSANLAAGANVTLTTGTDGLITIAAAGGGGGGGTTNIYVNDVMVPDPNFKDSSGGTFSVSGTNVTITAITTANNAGTGVGVLSGITSSTNITLNSIAGSNGITASSNANVITLALTVTNFTTLSLSSPMEAVSVMTNVAFWSPPFAGTLKGVKFKLLWPSTSGSVTADLLKNGTTVLSAPVSLASGATNSTASVSVSAFTADSVFTGAISAAGTAATNLAVQLLYTIP